MANTPKNTAAKAKAHPPRATAKATAAKPAEPAATASAEGAPGILRFKDLVEEVVKSTGAKPKDAKEIALATLAAMGAALGRGDALNLPEFGKGRIARSTVDEAGNAALVLKLRRGDGKKKETEEALAAAAE